MSENGSRAALITVLAGGVLRAALQVAFPGAASWLGRSSIVLPVTAQPHRLSEAIFLAKQGLSPYATGDYAGDPVLPSALAFLHSALARVPVSLDLLGSVLLDVAVGVALMLIWGSIGDRRVEKSTSRLSRIGWSDSWAVGGALSWCLNPFSIAVAAAGVYASFSIFLCDISPHLRALVVITCLFD